MILESIITAFLLIAAQGLYRNYGKPTFDALPPGLDRWQDWKGKDHDKVWYTRWVKYVKGWFAFGPRSAYSWARWSFPPKLLFKIGGKGPWRYEFVAAPDTSHVLDGHFMLSRCQYFKRWHLAVYSRPFMVTFHVYWRAKDVPPSDGIIWENDFGISKLLFLYGPIHWDADVIYWLSPFILGYLGGQWK
jgi:hypothetical protein